MKKLRFNPKNTLPDKQKSEKEKVFKVEDELPDAIRYALMAWPHLPAAVDIPTTRDLSQMPDKMQRDIERLQRRMKADDEKVKDGTGDFYSEYASEWEPMGESEEFSGFYA